MFVWIHLHNFSQICQTKYLLIITLYKRHAHEYFPYFSVKLYVVGTRLKCLSEGGLLMSTNSVCKHGEIRKNINTFCRKIALCLWLY